jgi:hypothetical protein
MAYRVAVIGAGWYGCHIGLSLLSLQMEVDVYEKADRVLHAASGNNQFRLHQGFHYARHHGTRIQSRDGFIRFTERYGNLSLPVAQNMYVVPQDSSLIDFDTYKMIMVSSGLSFIEITEEPDYLSNTEGVIQTHERVILIDRARRYFNERLNRSLHLSTAVEEIRESGDDMIVNGKRYDYVIDATWGHLGGLSVPVIFEPTLLLYYEGEPQIPAVTLVDGPLCSVYPTEDSRLYTLSSVPHTPLGQFASAAEALARNRSVTPDFVKNKREAMEQQILVNMPFFPEQYRFMGVQLAVKTKPIGKFDDRSCQVFRSGRRFFVMSGKIDTVFYATERIISMIGADHSNFDNEETSTMKAEMFLEDKLPSSPEAASIST